MKGMHAFDTSISIYLFLTTFPAILQRVKSASVTVDKQLISSIGRGILVLAAVGKEDTEKDADSLAAKILKAKLWPDDANASVRSTSTHRSLWSLSSNGLAVEKERAGYPG